MPKRDEIEAFLKRMDDILKSTEERFASQIYRSKHKLLRKMISGYLKLGQDYPEAESLSKHIGELIALQERQYRKIASPVTQSSSLFFASMLPGMSFAERDFTEDAVRYIEQFGLSRAKGMSDTMIKDFQNVIADGVRQGKGSREIARRLRQQMPELQRHRALMISRTETSNAMDHAKGLAEAPIRERLGNQAVSVWMTAGDERVRDSHAANNGRYIRLGESFPLGVAYAPAPRQSGDPAEDINCRCVLLTMPESEAIERGFVPVEG